METTNRINYFKNDFENIKLAFGNHLQKLGVFGSILQKEITEINDVDLALFVKNISLEDARIKAKSLLLSKAILVSKANGSYIQYEEPKPQNYFHLIILDSENPNKKFLEINKDKILYI